MNLSMTNTTERYYNQAIISFIAGVVVMVGLPTTIAVALQEIGLFQRSFEDGIAYGVTTLGFVLIAIVIMQCTYPPYCLSTFCFVVIAIAFAVSFTTRLSFRVTRCVGTMALLAQIQMTVFHPCVLIKLRQRFWALANATGFVYCAHRHDCYSVNDYCLEPIAGHTPVVGSSHCTSIIHKVNTKAEEL